MAEANIARHWAGVVVTRSENIPVNAIFDTQDLPRVSGQFESELESANGKFDGWIHGTRLHLRADTNATFSGEISGQLIVGTGASPDSMQPVIGITLFAQTPMKGPVSPGMYPAVAHTDAAAPAGFLTGQWTGTLLTGSVSDEDPQTVTLHLTHTGNALTGTFETDDGDFTGSVDGSVNGMTVTFTATPDQQGLELVTYTGAFERASGHTAMHGTVHDGGRGTLNGSLSLFVANDPLPMLGMYSVIP